MTGPAPSRPAPPRTRPGPTAAEAPVVRVIGYLGSEKGVGEGARATVRALRAAGIAVLPENVRDPTSDEYHSTLRAERDGPASVNIVHINPKELPELRDRLLAERAAGRVNIGYWAWELPELPESWRDCLDLLDEVWTPSRFVTDAVTRAAAGRSAVPVHTVPHCLDLAELTPTGDREPGPVTFVTAFDHRSDLGRKNPLGVIEAFHRAFGPGDPARLVVKSMHADFDPEGAARLRAAAGAGVRIRTGVLPRAEVVGLLAGCDCYVSLHRSEGFGLPLAEAMALGKPVIATGYSGNLDFMTAANSLLVRHTLVPVGPGHGDYPADQRWAEPDLAHAAELMRAVLTDRAGAAELGARARAELRETLSPATVGAALRDRLGQVRPVGRPPVLVRARPVECSIIVPVYGRAALTRDCLRALLTDRTEPAAPEIVVVDDASPDDTERVLGEFAGRANVLTHRENLGFARSCNDGAAKASGEQLVFLNNDTVPRPGWLTALLGYARATPAAGIIGAKLLYPDGTVQHAGVAICEDHRPRHIYRGFPERHRAVSVSRRFQVVTGACMLVRRGLFSTLGGFDPVFRNGFEDVDLCLRAAERGAEVHYCADCVLVHHESATRRGRPEEELRNFGLYWDRWAHRVVPDELRRYAADGLVRIKQYDRYPLEFELSPELGYTAGQPQPQPPQAQPPQPQPPQAQPPHRPATRNGRGVVGEHPRPRTAPPIAPGR